MADYEDPGRAVGFLDIMIRQILIGIVNVYLLAYRPIRLLRVVLINKLRIIASAPSYTIIALSTKFNLSPVGPQVQFFLYGCKVFTSRFF